MLIVRYTLDRGHQKCGTGGSRCIILGDSLREQPGFETQLVWPVTGLDATSVVDRLVKGLVMDHLGSQPRCLTGFVFSGGVCGLIGCKPTNLTTTTAPILVLVVHGCIQPLTSVEGAIRLVHFG